MKSIVCTIPSKTTIITVNQRFALRGLQKIKQKQENAENSNSINTMLYINSKISEKTAMPQPLTANQDTILHPHMFIEPSPMPITNTTQHLPNYDPSTRAFIPSHPISEAKLENNSTAAMPSNEQSNTKGVSSNKPTSEIKQSEKQIESGVNSSKKLNTAGLSISEKKSTSEPQFVEEIKEKLDNEKTKETPEQFKYITNSGSDTPKEVIESPQMPLEESKISANMENNDMHENEEQPSTESLHLDNKCRKEEKERIVTQNVNNPQELKQFQAKEMESSPISDEKERIKAIEQKEEKGRKQIVDKYKNTLNNNENNKDGLSSDINELEKKINTIKEQLNRSQRSATQKSEKKSELDKPNTEQNSKCSNKIQAEGLHKTFDELKNEISTLKQSLLNESDRGAYSMKIEENEKPTIHKSPSEGSMSLSDSEEEKSPGK